MSLDDQLRSPCGSSSVTERIQDLTRTNVKDLLDVIQRQSAIAKSFAESDIIKYISTRPEPENHTNTASPNKKMQLQFSTSSIEEFHETWKSMEQAWLYPQVKQLAKQFREAIPDEIHKHFKAAALTFDESKIVQLLRDSDERFQLLLIGFHNVIEDHESKRQRMDLEKFVPLLTVFSRAQKNTRNLLCEIRTALGKFGADPVIVNPRHVPSSKSASDNINFYDWVIYREYINQLEHIHEVIDVINKNIEHSSG